MHGISGPVEAFAIALRGIEDLLKLLDASSGAAEAKNAFNIGGCNSLISIQCTSRGDKHRYGGHRELTLLLQEDTTLCDNNGHIAVNEALTLVIGERNGNIRIFDADVEWNPEDTTFLQTY